MAAAGELTGFAGAGCGRRESFRGEYLHLSHFHRTPDLGPCWVSTAWGSWQHVLAPRQGSILMLMDSKVPLSCFVREVVSKRGIFNVCEEVPLNGLNREAHYCRLKRRKKSRKKEKVKKKEGESQEERRRKSTRKEKAKKEGKSQERRKNKFSCPCAATQAALRVVIRARAGTCVHAGGDGDGVRWSGSGLPSPGCRGVEPPGVDAVSFHLWEFQKRWVSLRKSERLCYL